MKHVRKRGISEAATAAVALLVALAVAVTAFSIYARNSATTVGGFEKSSGGQALKTTERLTLVYWDRTGRIWLANDGPDPVTIVQIYVNANTVWSGNITVQPRQTVNIQVGAGESLAVKTASGALHILVKK